MCYSQWQIIRWLLYPVVFITMLVLQGKCSAGKGVIFIPHRVSLWNFIALAFQLAVKLLKLSYPKILQKSPACKFSLICFTFLIQLCKCRIALAITKISWCRLKSATDTLGLYIIAIIFVKAALFTDIFLLLCNYYQLPGYEKQNIFFDLTSILKIRNY